MKPRKYLAIGAASLALLITSVTACGESPQEEATKAVDQLPASTQAQFCEALASAPREVVLDLFKEGGDIDGVPAEIIFNELESRCVTGNTDLS